VAAALSLPQLINFTFVQAAESDHFLRFQFNWCNNRGGNGLVDPYFWFYIKNVGFPYLLILLALLQRRRGDLRDEAERAAALTDGLYAKAPAPAAVEEAETAAPEPGLNRPKPNRPRPRRRRRRIRTRKESEPPLRQSLYAHGCPPMAKAACGGRPTRRPKSPQRAPTYGPCRR
jgi:hypothetical protein